MVTRARRKLSRLLGNLAFHVDPDPPVQCTTRRLDTPVTPEVAEMIAAAISGEIGGRVGLGFRRPGGESGEAWV